jgi:hypothetical protein
VKGFCYIPWVEMWAGPLLLLGQYAQIWFFGFCSVNQGLELNYLWFSDPKNWVLNLRTKFFCSS